MQRIAIRLVIGTLLAGCRHGPVVAEETGDGYQDMCEDESFSLTWIVQDPMAYISLSGEWNAEGWVEDLAVAREDDDLSYRTTGDASRGDVFRFVVRFQESAGEAVETDPPSADPSVWSTGYLVPHWKCMATDYTVVTAPSGNPQFLVELF